jgi:MMPL family
MALDPQRTERLPARRELVVQLLLLFGSPDAMRPFVAPDYDQAAITVRTRTGGGQALRKLLADVDDLATEVLPADVQCTARGELLLTSRAADETTRRLLTGSARALILVIALMMIATRRVWPFIRLALPVCLATAVSFGATALGSLSLGPVTVVAPWIGLAAAVPLVLARAGDGKPGPRDWLPLAVVGAAFLPLLASTLRFNAALGIGVAAGCAVAAGFLWADGGVEED